MKHLILAALMFGNACAFPQEPLSYHQLLENIIEIDLADSLQFDARPQKVVVLDSFTVKKWFAQVLPSNAVNKFKNRKYSLAGKITRQPNFDLLVLSEEKRKGDSTAMQVTYLISLKKNGDFIASLKAAAGGTKKRTGFNISSCLYRDYKIVQDSRITIDEKAYNDMVYYKINNGGRFVSYPKFD